MSSATHRIEHKRIHASARMHTPLWSLQEVLKLLGPKSNACVVSSFISIELNVHVWLLRNCANKVSPLSCHKSLFKSEFRVHFHSYQLLVISVVCLLLNKP